MGVPALNTGRIIELLEPVADAVDHAHGCGVIHRDVKRSNVLVDGDGCPYLADFGIAHLLDVPRMTTDFVATPAYQWVLARGLARQPADRYPSCVALIAAASAALGRPAASACRRPAAATEADPPLTIDATI